MLEKYWGYLVSSQCEIDSILQIDLSVLSQTNFSSYFNVIINIVALKNGCCVIVNCTLWKVWSQTLENYKIDTLH